jgi:hypothetical protein
MHPEGWIGITPLANQSQYGMPRAMRGGEGGGYYYCCFELGGQGMEDVAVGGRLVWM